MLFLFDIRPLLELNRQKLIEECAENDKALLDVENSILQMLSGSGNILEDEDAVDILDNSKVLPIIIRIMYYAGT